MGEVRGRKGGRGGERREVSRGKRWEQKLR